MRFVVLCCVIAVAVGVLLIERDIDRLVLHADQVLVQLSAHEKQAAVDEHGTSQNLNAALIQIGLTTDDVRRSAQVQTAYWNKTSKQTQETVAALHSMINRTDQSLNGQLVPNVNTLLKESQAFLRVTADNEVQLTTAGNETLDAATHSIETLNQQLEDPDIRGIFHNADSFTAHGDHIIGYYDQRLTSPRGFVKTLGRGLWQLVVPATNIAIAVK